MERTCCRAGVPAPTTHARIACPPAGALAAAPSLVAAQQYDSIVDAAKAKDLKLFLKMADATGFTPQLESPGFIGTVFAPTDDAVETALATAGTTMDQLLRNNSLAVDVIMYHVIPGQSVSSDNLQHDGTYTSMRGKPLTITKRCAPCTRWGSSHVPQALQLAARAPAVDGSRMPVAGRTHLRAPCLLPLLLSALAVTWPSTLAARRP